MAEENGNGKTTRALLGYIEKDLRVMQQDIKDVKVLLQHDYVTKEVFDVRVGRLEKLAYGAVATILLAVLTAGLALIIRAS